MNLRLVLVALTVWSPLLARALDPAEERLGFVALSDGKTFTGWKQDGNWEIQDGAFVRVRPKGSLTYEAQLVPDDFELRFEWKVSALCNSGVYYRPGQVEYQVLDDAHPVYGENPRQSAASLFFCMGPKKRATRPVGEWNTARIICKGSVIEHWLNEERVLSFDYTDPKWAKEVELLRIRGGDLTGRGGKLSLQDHGQDVAFRNLRMRTIPASEPVKPDPNFQPLPVPPAALAKEEARVRGMLEKAKPKPEIEAQRRWPLDAVDAALKVHGSATVAAGAQGKSLVLDGSAVIELNDTAALDGGADGFTFSVWFNPYAPESGQQVIAGKNRYSLKERQWSLTIEPDGTLRAYLQQNGWATIASKEPLKAGTWHMATLAVGAKNAALYLDGKAVGKVTLKQPVAPTPAPITLGGINDNDRLKQQFHGAVDEVRFEPRVLHAEEIAASYRPVSATHEVPKPRTADFPLWDERQKLAEAGDLPVLEGVEFHVIKKWDKTADGYTFLHGVGLAWHMGRLYASIGHNKGEENTVTEEAQYRVSDDGGRSWSDLRVIDAGEEPELAVSHGVFASHAGRLWAFHGAYYGRMQRIHTRAYSLDETSGKWVKHGVVVENGFWALNQPVKMNDGNWIMAGLSAGSYSDRTTNPAAVAISHGDDFTKWDFVRVPAPQGMRMWGESGIIVDGANVLNIARYGAKALALVARSADYGRTWTTMAESNLPMATSKPAAGLLGNGQRYLVCTTAANNGGRRAPLTIAVSKPGESVLSKVFVIRHAESSAGGESAARLSLSYPCATEHEGKLYVGYSNNGGRAGNLNSAELAIIPIDRLKAE